VKTKIKYKPTAARTTPELCERARKSEKGGTQKNIYCALAVAVYGWCSERE
jgi:hypothetical protein